MGELILFFLLKVILCVVLFIVSKFKNIEKLMVYNLFGWGDLGMLIDFKDLKFMVEKMWIMYMK